MRKRIIPALSATLVAAMLVAAQPALGAGNAGTGTPVGVSGKASAGIAGVYHRILRATAALAGLANTGLDALPDLTLKLEAHPDAPSLEPDAPRVTNAWRLRIQPAEPVDSRFSLIVDMSEDEAPHLKPVRGNHHMPTKDKFWLALGAGYRHSEHFSVDLGYTRLFINQTYSGGSVSTVDQLFGDYGKEMDLIGANLRWQFD